MKNLLTIIFVLVTSFAYSQWTTSGTNIYNTNSGSVGIGTSAPNGALHVYKLNNSVIRLGSVATGNTWFSLGTSADANGYSFLQSCKTEGAANGYGDLILNRLGGKVGIGLSAPNSTLHVYGGSGNLSAMRLGNGNTGTTHVSFGVNADANGYAYIQSVKTEGSVWGDLMINSQGGNVGIGTTTTDAKLCVKGTIHAQEVKVDLAGSVAPDYVFANNYELLTLDQVKQYISANKHLPNVPSAAEFESNGMNLGEMNYILLRKVEELTLYTIQQNETIKKMEQRMAELEARIEQK